MRVRLTLLSVLAFVAAGLVFPTSVAAGDGFNAKVIYNYCHRADPHMKVKNVARGTTNANKLTTETWVERRPANKAQWTKIYEWQRAKYKFSVNGDKHWLTSWRTWKGDRSHWYRIGFRVRAWHNRTLLSSEVLYSVKC